MKIDSKATVDPTPSRMELKRPTRKQAEQAVRTLLLWAGDDPDREGLQNTPQRVVDSYREIFGGYSQSAERILGTFFEEVGGYNDPVLIRDIPFFSHCEHHMVPIVGKAHVAYLPNGRVIGLSKVPRIVDMYAQRLQTQESITAQIADTLANYLNPLGVAVMVEAEHLCMAMRGIKKQGSATVTVTFRGKYETDETVRANFMTLLRGIR